MRGILRRLRHMFVSDDFKVDGHSWYYRVSEGEYDWAIALSASPKDTALYSPYAPFAIYAYKVKDRYTGLEGYVLAIYPKGCEDPLCAIHVYSEIADESIVDWIESVAELAPLYYKSPTRFFEELHRRGMHVLSHEELEDYEFIRPHPGLAEKLANTIRREKYVKIKRI